METELGIVISARDWAERLHRFTVDHGGARVRARVLRPEDAIIEEFDVLIIDDVTSFLSRRLVQQVQSRGRSVVGVWDAENNPAGRSFLEELGVDDAIESSASPEEFIRVTSAFGRAERVAQVMEADDSSSTENVEDDRGQLVVVGASSGGAGATEVAVALAAVLADNANRPLLIDADDVVPSVAQRLGVALHPNLRTSVDALLNQPDRLQQTFHSSRKVPFDVVAGLSNTQDWIELRSGDVVSLAREATERRPFVIANISSRIEDLSYHGGAPRYELARSLVGAADQAVIVSSPTPIGVARALEWIAQVRPLAPHRPIHLVLNRAPKSVFKTGELTEEIARSYTPASLSFLQEDRRVAEAAWAGEVVGGGPFRKGVEQVAGAIVAARSLSPVPS